MVKKIVGRFLKAIKNTYLKTLSESLFMGNIFSLQCAILNKYIYIFWPSDICPFLPG